MIFSEYQYSTYAVMGQYICNQFSRIGHCLSGKIRKVTNTFQSMSTGSHVAFKQRTNPFAHRRSGENKSRSRKENFQASLSQSYKMHDIHRSVRQSVAVFQSDLFPIDETSSPFSQGAFGCVRSDENSVIKIFKSKQRLIAENLLDRDQIECLDIEKMAQMEAYCFNLYYGEDAAILTKRKDLSGEESFQIKMKKIKGIDLQSMTDDAFEFAITNHMEKLFDMMAKLFSVGIVHDDFLMKNIMYDDGIFYPIDISNTPWHLMANRLELMQSSIQMTEYIARENKRYNEINNDGAKKPCQYISLDFKLADMDTYHVQLTFLDLENPNKDQNLTFKFKPNDSSNLNESVLLEINTQL